MRIIIVCSLVLAVIFLLLARANRSRRKIWAKAFRLKATVTRIRYSEARPFWILHLILAALFLLTAIAFIFHGNYILTELSDYRVESPNLTGGIFLGIMGIFLLIFAAACFVFFIPMCLRPFFGPILWSVKYIFGAFEPVEARCTGLIRKDRGEDGYSYYPLFAYTDPQKGRMQWHTSREKPKKHFQMDNIYTLYLNRKSGACSLMPPSSEIVSIVFSIIPAGFALFFTLSLAIVALVLLYCAVISF